MVMMCMCVEIHAAKISVETETANILLNGE